VLAQDVTAAYDGDPAAKSLEEIIFCYPSVRIVTIYRFAHELHLQAVPMIPRMLSEFAHASTGCDIHPGAEIGYPFFIDHGTGVVIGETAVIGKNVRIYQGVTLGGLAFPKDEEGRLIRDAKRHPTLEDDCVVYAGATILGGETVIGKGSVIGGNVWLTHSVPPYTKVVARAPEAAVKPLNGKRAKEEVKKEE
jgi:serine O-acetyltransferase